MLNIADYSQRIEMLRGKVQEAFSKINRIYPATKDKSNTIRIVFAGQYSAGKSSILKMLTGSNDIDIGAGITTQETHTYQWNGLEVIDTPGIGTELRLDHDEISYQAIASADMLVFVVTNELFDSHLAEHFRKLAIEKDKAGEMILIVNKMERTSNGNTENQQAIIREDLRKVLDPYTPEQLNLCFLDAESYLEALAEDDLTIKGELIERSGYISFFNTLNRFIKEKSISSKLTTELYEMDELLDNTIIDLKPRSDDVDIDALEEHYTQQRHVLTEGRINLRRDVKDIFSTAGAKIRDMGLDAANLLIEGCKQKEVENDLERLIILAQEVIENCQLDAKKAIETRLVEMGQAIETIEDSSFSQQLKSRLSGKFEGLPENVKALLESSIPGLERVSQTVVNNAYRVGVTGGMKLSNFSGSTVHNIVLNAGHAVGFKFQPWQAVKITKGIAVAGKVLGILGVGLSVFMQIKEDSDADRIREDLKRNRQDIRSQFNTAANELEIYGAGFVQDNVISPLDGPIDELNKNIGILREGKANKSAVCREMELLQKECRSLIQKIHAD